MQKCKKCKSMHPKGHEHFKLEGAEAVKLAQKAAYKKIHKKKESKAHEAKESKEFESGEKEGMKEKYKGRKPKPQGRGIVKALGQKKTTGNFAKIKASKGTGAAIAALQNKLAKRRGQSIPFHR